MDEKEKRKAEVRARMEQQAAASKKKKGFMTPARKKKLRNLIRQLAAEELKKELLRKAEERRRILAERTGDPKNIAEANEAELMAICKEYQDRIAILEGEKYEHEYNTAKKDFEKRELSSKVNDVRGKFTKPSLKKVSKAQAQMEKIKMFAAKANQMDHRMGLKSVKKFAMADDKEEEKKPDWSAGIEKKDKPAGEITEEVEAEEEE
jgi:hypothetical protein